MSPIMSRTLPFMLLTVKLSLLNVLFSKDLTSIQYDLASPYVKPMLVRDLFSSHMATLDVG